MHVLIPAAGQSTRFLRAGYAGPKGLLRVQAPTPTGWSRPRLMLDWVLRSVPLTCQATIVVREEDHHLFTRRELLDSQPDRARVRLLSVSSTRGQADTVLQGLEQLRISPQSDAVLVMNCDGVVQDSDEIYRMWWPMENHFMHTLLVRDDRPASAPPIYSYVDHPERPTQFAEKRRISDWAQAGVWYFPDAGSLRRELAVTVERASERGEVYLSAVLPRLAPARGSVSRTWVDLGTPESISAAGWRIAQ